MYMSLLAFGILATAAGVAMLGFGIAINEFSLGNTLLITGTIAVLGGPALIGIAAVIRHLRRIAEALVARPIPRPARPLDPFESSSPESSRTGAATRMPFPPLPSERSGRESAPLEPRLAAAPSIDAAKDGAFGRPHIPFPPRVAPELQVEDEPDAAPLSPRESASEVTIPSPADMKESDRGALPISQLDLSLRPAPPTETVTENGLFDSLWPARAQPSKTAEVPEQPEIKPEPAEMPSARQEDNPPETSQPAEPASAAAAVTILKSGVIDEMAYTLYSDGSIEAELPQGIMRFGSIAELRGYLEKSP
jgi:hypothetical protein